MGRRLGRKGTRGLEEGWGGEGWGPGEDGKYLEKGWKGEDGVAKEGAMGRRSCVRKGTTSGRVGRRRSLVEEGV